MQSLIKKMLPQKAPLIETKRFLFVLPHRAVILFLIILLLTTVSGIQQLSPSEDSDVNVLVDNNPPIVIIITPESIAYSVSAPVPVDYAVLDISTNSVWYSLNDGENTTTFEPFSLNLPEGIYTLRIYANDSFNRIGFSEVSFTVEDFSLFCGDNICDATEDCSSCSIDCGVCPVSSSGSGGGGSVLPSILQKKEIKVIPSEITIDVTKNVPEQAEITIINNKNRDIFLTLKTSPELEQITTFEQESITLPANGEEKITVSFLANKQELILGKLLLKENSVTLAEIPVRINMKSQSFLFDTMLLIPEEFKSISSGTTIPAQVSLSQIGKTLRIDLTVDYEVKDIEGKFYKKETEVFSIAGKKEFVKEISTEELPAGKYVLSMKISYSGYSSVSSEKFEVTGKSLSASLPLIIGTFLTVFILIITAFYVYKKLRKKPELPRLALR